MVIDTDNELPQQAVFDLSKLDLDVEPARLYDMPLDMAMKSAHYVVHVFSLKQEGKYGAVKVSMVPIIEIMLDEIKDAYCKGNNGDFYSNMATLGHARIQHRYNLNHKAMRTLKSRIISEGKLEKLAAQYKRKENLFFRVEGGREQIPVYLDIDGVIAPTTQYRKSFNVSKSDLIQVYLCEAILQYEGMEAKNKEFFLETLGEFDKTVKTFQGALSGL